MIRISSALATATAVCMALAPAALASHPQPAPDIDKMDYAPVGHFKPGDPIPAPNEFDTKLRPLMTGLGFNPSGKYNAYDTNVFETLGLPFRAAGDESANDEYGNGGDSRHGFCDSDADPDLDTEHPGEQAKVAGECPNHQLEYGAYFEETMDEILGDYGVTFRRYRFDVAQGGNTLGGTAVNTAAIVPGADHPEETVIVSGHFDQTTEGPASAWDSAEGHAQVIRMAKIMSDYWRATGTRPSATVKFVPWDAEEAGTLGSLHYAQNNVVPGEEAKVRGYFNTDPCAGAYPAYRFGNPADRVSLGIQVANPDRLDDVANLGDTTNPPAEARARIDAFNGKVPTWVEQVFDHIDDTLVVGGTPEEIFVSTAEGGADGSHIGSGKPVMIQDSRPLLFSSDWKNFEDLGIPFMNPGPDITGPSSQGEYGQPDGLAILHTPNDNLQMLNRYTGGGMSGDAAAEGWIKGMEMCAHLLSWGMLQPEQAGGQTTTDDVVAYYEALPNEATSSKPVRFNAEGSYQYATATGRDYVDPSTLRYEWDFGDGATGSGTRAQHAYAAAGRYTSTLTVTNTETGESDSMSIPVTVAPAENPSLGGPVLDDLPDKDEDGTFDLEWQPAGGGPDKYVIEESSTGGTVLEEDAEGELDAKWTSETNSTDGRVRKWEKTSDSSLMQAGNKKQSGASSFWTGAFPSEPPTDFESVLTLKQPLDLPSGGDLSLSYWSYYRNDLTDVAAVEVAVEDNDPQTAPAWFPVDTILGDDNVAYLPGLDLALNGELALNEQMVHRRVSLGRFAGQKVMLRFRANFTTRDGVFIVRNGWYVDDIRIDFDRFQQVGESDATSFAVTDRAGGENAYRVRAVYDDGVITSPSNVERIRIEPGAPGKPPAQQEPPGGDGQTGGQGGGGGNTDGTGGGPGGTAGGSGGGGQSSTPAVDRRAPRTRATFRSTYPLLATLRRGLTGALTSDEAATVSATAEVSARTAASLGLAAKPVVVARGKLTFKQAGRQKLVLRFIRAAKAKLRSGRSVKLRLRIKAVDNSGNVTAHMRTVRLKSGVRSE